MSNPFGNLSEENHEQIRKYLRFFRQKKDGILRTVTREFADAKVDRLNDEMFTKEDVEEFADFMESAVRTQVAADLSSIINMGTLAVCQLLESAQDKGAELSLETATVENQALLEAVEKMSLEVIPKRSRGIGHLTSFKEEAKARREETERFEDTNRQLQAEVGNLSRRLVVLSQELQAAQRAAEVASASNTASSSSSAGGSRGGKTSAGEEKNEYDGDSEQRIRRLEQSLREALDENEKRVSETAQFQQMRKLMQTQSNNIRDLRRRLQRYEPDIGAKEDDG